jgi:hypothetical protein
LKWEFRLDRWRLPATQRPLFPPKRQFQRFWRGFFKDYSFANQPFAYFQATIFRFSPEIALAKDK